MVGATMSNTITEAIHAQTNQEAIDALRAQVAALTEKVSRMSNTLLVYASTNNWDFCSDYSKTARQFVYDYDMDRHSGGWELAQAALNVATTAPVDAGA